MDKKMINKIIFTLALTCASLNGQYVKVATHYDAEQTANQIIKGKLNKYLNNKLDFSFEKRKNKFIDKYDVEADHVEKQVYKYFDKGKPEYISKTNGGYTFTIAVINNKDDTDILYYCSFALDAFTSKIKSVEIDKGY